MTTTSTYVLGHWIKWLKVSPVLQKTAGRKRPTIVNPSHSTSGSLGPHKWLYEMFINSIFKKIEFRKICGHTTGHTDGKNGNF